MSEPELHVLNARLQRGMRSPSVDTLSVTAMRFISPLERCLPGPGNFTTLQRHVICPPDAPVRIGAAVPLIASFARFGRLASRSAFRCATDARYSRHLPRVYSLRARPKLIGSTRKVPSRPDRKRQNPMHTVCGILMQSGLAVTTEGISWSIDTRPEAQLANTMMDAAIEKVANSNNRPVVHSDRAAHIAGQVALAHTRCEAGSLDVAQRMLARQCDLRRLLRAAKDGAVLFLGVAGCNH